ncbi:MAG: WD40 repeat domain-containing protein [Caldilineaceae bacterium]
MEEAIMMWLGTCAEPVAIQTLAAQISPPISTAAVMGALRSLQRRALVERRGGGFTLQNVVMEYTTDRLVKSLQAEILGAPLHILANHALVKMRAKEYIRSIQERLILVPLADALVAHAGRAGAVTRLRRLLDDVRGHTAWSSSYAAGNILNVLRYIEGSLHDLDVSDLTVRDLNLRDTHVEHVNFAGATIKDAAFSQQFGHILRISYHPDGGTIAARTGDEEIRIWRTTDGQLAGAFTMPSNLIFPVLYSPDGRLLLAGGAHTDLILCDADNCETRLVLRGHRHRVWDAAFSADGRYLATASADQTVRIWDPQTGSCLHELRGHDDAVMALAFHPDGTRLISAADDGRIQVWNVHDGTAEDGWTTAPGLRALALHPNGALLATGGTDGAITLWEGTSGRIRAHLPAHAAGVSALAFDATGALLASAGEAGAIRLWDVETMRVRAVLEGHTAAVGHLAFHPHLSQLASAGWDRTLRIWDSQSAQPLMTLYGLRAGVRALAFAPDAQRLYSGSDDGSVYAWPVADFMAGGSGATDRTARDSTPDDLAGLPAAVSGVVCTPDQRGLILGCWDNTVRIMDLATRRLHRARHGGRWNPRGRRRWTLLAGWPQAAGSHRSRESPEPPASISSLKATGLRKGRLIPPAVVGIGQCTTVRIWIWKAARAIRCCAG